MPETARLLVALRELTSSDWEAFERFCGAFFADEFSMLRSIGGSGDKGRDGVLFVTEQSGVVLQYSIVGDWRAKIRQTISRLREADIACTVLIYATNQDIGPRADDLSAELRRENVTLDVRDQRYFVDRINRSRATRMAVEELTARIVDPLMPARELVRNSDLPPGDLRAGLLYLELQLHDADNQQNLTKLCVDALILSVLVATNPDHMKTRATIIDEIRQRFPSHDVLRLRELITGSLKRLKHQRRVIFTQSTDSYALHHSERRLLAQKADAMVLERRAVRNAISERMREAADLLTFPGDPGDSEAAVDAVEATFEALLDRYGTDFVARLRGNRPDSEVVDLYDVTRTTVFVLEPKLRELRFDLADVTELIVETSGRILTSPGEGLQRYLRALADAYTMLAFLRETPDVKRALEDVFQSGRLVLDATVLLPCFVETLIPEAERRFTNLLRAAGQAGMELVITEGVLNEVDAHLSLSIVCRRMEPARWQGPVPRVLADWYELNPAGGDFVAFVEEFRGEDARVDLFDFFNELFGVSIIDLSLAMAQFDMEFRGSFTELWRPRKRVRAGQAEDERDLLLRHDVEMYLGVLGLRREEDRPALGYRNWWVTSDGSAHAMYRVARQAGLELPSSATMHPAFLPPPEKCESPPLGRAEKRWTVHRVACCPLHSIFSSRGGVSPR